MNLRTALAAALVLIPLPVFAQQDLLDRAAAAYARIRTARASFEQTLTNPLTGTTLSARGDYQQEMPSRLSVLFTDPKGDRIVADGKSVWLYLPSTTPGQVLRLSGAMGAGSVDLVGQFFTEPRERFAITDQGPDPVGDRATRRYELLPKKVTTFTRALVWIDPADTTLRQFEVTETSGLVRRIRITRLALNVPVDAKAFTFTPPKGARVLDQGRLQGDAP
jgi:outer membrane lipoprotein carrier protein